MSGSMILFSSIAKNKEKLKEIGITHIVNCAMGTKMNQINTDQTYFEDVGIKFHGIRALDIFTFKMSPHFEPAALFMDEAINNGGKICLFFFCFFLLLLLFINS